MLVRALLRLHNGDMYPLCPRCGHLLEREYMRFCDNCGQRLGWEGLTHAKIILIPK